MTARLLLAVCMTSQSETSITHSPYRLLTRYPHSERIPLLQSAAPVAHIKGSPTLAKAPQVVTAFTTGPITTDMAASRTLYTLGWAEHVLPDSSVYYYHATRRVSTDIDLRNPRFLQHVTEYLEKTLPRQTTIPPPAGWELWLKSVPLRKEGRTEQSWVNHKLRILTSEPPPSVSGDGLILERFSEDDRESLFAPARALVTQRFAGLDMEYRYWGFIEGHPAHVPLQTETQTEAMDALKWSYTGTFDLRYIVLCMLTLY